MFQSIFKLRSNPPAQSRQGRPRQFSIESLERREMMAGDIALQTIDGVKTLVLDGSNGPDTAYVATDGAFHLKATLNGATERFPLASVQKILFKGYNGNDAFDNDTSVPAHAYGHAGNDRLLGGTGRDYLSGGSGNDVLHGSGGNDVLKGGAGDDDLYGGNGDDRYVFAGSNLGHDEIFGTAGVNTIDLSDRGGSNTLDLARTSKQTVKSGHLYLTLHSASAVDHVFGSDYADSIRGNALANRIFGNGGNDTLTGRGGADYLNGGAGTDVFPELKTTSWNVSFSSPGWNSSSIETQRIYPTSGYDVVGSKWQETSAIRADSSQLWNANYVDVHAFLYPQQFGGGGARVAGTLTLEMMPDGDKLVK